MANPGKSFDELHDGKGHLEGVKEILLDNGFSYTLYKSLEY